MDIVKADDIEGASIQESGVLLPTRNEDPTKTENETAFPPPPPKKDIDTGWAWVVLVCCFLNMIILGASMSVVGLFHIFLLDAFDERGTVTALVGSIYIGLQNLMGPLASCVSDRWSCRTCMVIGGLVSSLSMAVSSQATSLWMSLLTYGILSGTGLAMVLTTTFSSIGYSFEKYRSIASSICVIGHPFGMIIGPVLVNTLEHSFGWRGASLLFSGMLLNLCVLALLQRPSSKEIQQKKSSRKKTCFLPDLYHAIKCVSIKRDSLLRNKSFLCLMSAFLLSNFAISIIYLHMPLYVLGLGGADSDIQSIYALMGFGNMASKILIGLGSGSSGVHLNKLCLLFGAYSIAGTSLSILPSVSHTQAGRLFCFFLVSFYYAVESPLYVPLSVDMLPLKYLNLAIGYELCSSGVGYMAGPPFAAWVRKISNDYKYSFYVAGASFLLATIFCLCSVVNCRRNSMTKDRNKKLEIPCPVDTSST